MSKGSKKDRRREGGVSVRRPQVQQLAALAPVPGTATEDPEPVGAKKVKKKCCRSTPRCKGCPVVALRTARLRESGLTGKDLKKAVKRARAA